MSAGNIPLRRGESAHPAAAIRLTPEASPSWLRPLVDNVAKIPSAYRRRLPIDVLATVTAAGAKARITGAGRDAAVLVLFSGPGDADGGGFQDADLLVTVRAATLRQHAGQAAFPGGAADVGDSGPVATAFREANEETGVDPARLSPLVTMEKIFIAPSEFHVVPVLAYSPDPGSVTVVDPGETAIVARVPLRAFINPANRLMVYRDARSRRWAGPAFLLNEMLVWGFTGHVISAMLEVAGWAQRWDTGNLRELGEAMELVGDEGGARR